MALLRMVKKVQCLTMRIATLNRFFFKSIESSLPFFRALKQMDFQWMEECQATFHELKRYLNSPPVFSK